MSNRDKEVGVCLLNKQTPVRTVVTRAIAFSSLPHGDHLQGDTAKSKTQMQTGLAAEENVDFSQDSPSAERHLKSSLLKSGVVGSWSCEESCN